MLIKLRCKNSQCLYTYEITEAEFLDNWSLHKYCLNCGGANEVVNLSEIIDIDIRLRIKNEVDKSVQEKGWDNTLDMIKRHKDSMPYIYQLYVDEVSRRGFKLQ
jgi:hypothetical protein